MDLKAQYNYRSKEIEQKLSMLKAIIKKHKRLYEKNANNWGYLGDLINLDNRLDDLIHFTKM
jgi:hypothetical protein